MCAGFLHHVIVFDYRKYLNLVKFGPVVDRLRHKLTTELDTGLLLKTKMPTWSKRPETRLNMEYSGTLCDKITRSRWVSFNIPPRHYVNSWFIRLRLRNTVVWPIHTAQMFAWGGGYLYLYSVYS